MSPPRRTVAILVALAAAAVAVSIGVTSAIERARPGAAGPPPAPFVPVGIPRADAHQHVTAGTVDEAARLARAQGIGLVVNVSGGALGHGLEAALAAAAKADGRVVVLANLDFAGCCGPAWAAREGDRLENARALGARGLALPSALGLERPIALDDAALDPAFEACDRLGLPVFVHGAAPGALERRVARHPRVRFVAAAFGGLARDPAAASALLDRLPNLSVDTAAVDDLGREPAAARAAILAHPDRVLFGSAVELVELPPDVKAVVFGGGAPGGRAEMLRFFDGTWRFFETRDADIPSPVPAEGDWPIAGIGLPRGVLERVYRRNAEELLGVAVPEGER